MAPHVVLREAGYKFDLEKVDIPNKKTAGGEDYWKINPKGYVPALKLDDGQFSPRCRSSASTSPTTRRTQGSRPRRHDGALPPHGDAQLHRERVPKQIGALFNPR